MLLSTNQLFSFHIFEVNYFELISNNFWVDFKIIEKYFLPLFEPEYFFITFEITCYLQSLAYFTLTKLFPHNKIFCKKTNRGTDPF